MVLNGERLHDRSTPWFPQLLHRMHVDGNPAYQIALTFTTFSCAVWIERREAKRVTLDGSCYVD